MKKFICNTCGYIYDAQIGDTEHNILPNTAFENLPDDWTCPVCGMPKSDFSPSD